MSPIADFAQHRRELLSRLAEDEAVLLFGSPHHKRNSNTDYRYRAHSDVYWASGWEDPECAVFLRPGEAPFTMFVQAKDKDMEVWNGFRHGPEGAKKEFGADAAYTYEQLDVELPRLLQGVSTLHYAFGRQPAEDKLVQSAVFRAERASRRSGLAVPELFVSPSRLLHELRLHKKEDEIAVMRESARITALAHRVAMAFAAPGKNEREVEALVEHQFRTHGGNGPGYGSIIAGGANACILHYIKNNQPLRDGDLLLIDAGCEYGYYTADVTRTFPVNGKFSAAQRAVYEHVLAAQAAAIEKARKGISFREMHDAAVRRLTIGLVELGILRGDIDELVEKDAFKKYYMHGTGHWLGLDVHDAGAYVRNGRSRPLAPGMVVTVEPGLYLPADDLDLPPELRGIGIRIEDDIHITEDGFENLTEAIPKTVADVEAACVVEFW